MLTWRWSLRMLLYILYPLGSIWIHHGLCCEEALKVWWACDVVYWRKNGCCPVAGWYSISSEYPGFERWCMIFCIRFWEFCWQWWLPNTDGTWGAWRIYDGFETDMHVIFKVCFSLLFNDRWWDTTPDALYIVTFHSCCCLQNLCLCSSSCICFFMFQCFQICLKSGLFQFQLGLLFF